MKSIEEIQQIIAESHGTGVYYRFHKGTIITEGVKHVADAAECWWFLDVICSYQPQLRRKELRYQSWQIVRTENTLGNGPMAVVTCHGHDEREQVRQEIEFTDFPLQDLTIYACINDPDGDPTADLIIYLPSED